MDKGTPKGAGFFHIDRRTWAAVCDAGDLNAAVAYVTLAAGTGEGNDITKWAAKSLRTHMGMRLENGKAAIQKLIALEVVAYGPEHTTAKPRYHILPWAETKAANKGKKKPFTGSLVAAEDTEHRIWLPNSLIINPAGDGPPPVRMLRMANDLWALRLLVDLYHFHLLDSDGGVSSKYIRYQFDRRLCGQQGIFNVWGFKQAGGQLWKYAPGPFQYDERAKTKDGEDSPVWQAVGRLQRTGLIVWVPHLFPNDSPDAEPIHSLGHTYQKAEKAEENIRMAAGFAGQAMLQAGQQDQAAELGFQMLVPVPNYLDKVEVRSVLRLRFRPQTSLTGKWWEGLETFGTEWVRRYKELEDKGKKADWAVTEWEAWGT